MSTEAAPLDDGQVTSLFPAAFFIQLSIQDYQKPIKRLTEGLHIVYLSEVEFDHYLQTLQKCDIKQVKYLENKHAHHQAATRWTQHNTLKKTRLNVDAIAADPFGFVTKDLQKANAIQPLKWSKHQDNS